MRDALEHAIEVGDAVETAVVGYGGDAVIVAVGQLFTGFIDAHLIEEGDESVHRMFFEISAKCLGGHVGLFGGVIQCDWFIILLHDKIIDGADTDAFMFAVSGRLRTGRQGHQFMETTERFQEIDEMDQLVHACAVLYHQHPVGNFRKMLGWNFKPGLLRLQKIFYIFYFGKIEEGIKIPPGVKKDIEGLYLFPAFGCKIGGVAFENMGKISAQPIDLVGPEGMHIVLCHQRTFSLLDPGELYLLVTVKMGIEVRQYIFLHNDSLIMWDRDSELQYFHIPNIRILRILSLLGQNEEKTG